MNQHFKLQRLAAGIALLGGCALASAANLSPANYDAAKDQVRTSYKAERENCDKLAGNAKDICVETAKGREKVSMAHLQYQRSGEAGDMVKVQEARADARYEIAKEMCDDKGGNDKDVCKTTAKAEHDTARANVKANKQVAEARDEAYEARVKADYKVARERCDVLSGDPKDVCLASAKARYDQ